MSENKQHPFAQPVDLSPETIERLNNARDPNEDTENLPFDELATPEELAALDREITYLEKVEEFYKGLANGAETSTEDRKNIEFLDLAFRRIADEQHSGDDIEALKEMTLRSNTEKDGFVLLKSVLRRLTYTMEKCREQMVAAAQVFSISAEWEKTKALFDLLPPEEDEREPNLSYIVDFIATADLIEFETYIREFDRIYPAAAEIIKETRAATGKPVRLEDFFSNDDEESGGWKKSLYEMAVERSKLRPFPQHPRTAIKRAEIVELPLDKVNSTIWNLLKEDTAGQIAIAMERSGSTREINTLYAINFEELGEDIKISKRLTAFDKRVYIAISALFNAGNNVITLTQIHYAMGNTKRPSKDQLEKINNAVTKMMKAQIMVNNSEEASVYNYDRFIYDGALLPLERGTAIVNGQLADAAIHIFREPPMVSFAKQRKQITTVAIKLLQSPISKTEGNLQLEDYLLERIARASKGKQPHKILYKTLYEKAEINTDKQKQRASKKITTYLDHYKSCGLITKYALGKDGITVYFT